MSRVPYHMVWFMFQIGICKVTQLLPWQVLIGDLDDYNFFKSKLQGL